MQKEGLIDQYKKERQVFIVQNPLPLSIASLKKADLANLQNH
jgi:hypothetical protein